MIPLRVGFPIRISTDQSLLAAPRGFSQRATSFIASWCQGIHRMPLSYSDPGTPEGVPTMHGNHRQTGAGVAPIARPEKASGDGSQSLVFSTRTACPPSLEGDGLRAVLTHTSLNARRPAGGRPCHGMTHDAAFPVRHQPDGGMGQETSLPSIARVQRRTRT